MEPWIWHEMRIDQPSGSESDLVICLMDTGITLLLYYGDSFVYSIFA